jgi:lipoprotein-anchoring transpeptidase ErfK/SrfK
MGAMQVKPRQRGAYTITTVGPYAGSRTARRRRRRWPWIVGFVVVAVALAALAYGYSSWPRGGLAADPAALARVSKPTFGGSTSVSVHTDDGTAVPVSLRSDGTLWPLRRVDPGTRLEVEAVFHRPGWAGWLAGDTQRVTMNVVAPTSALTTSFLQIRKGAPLVVHFTRPVRALDVTDAKTHRLHRLPRPARAVWLGRLGDAGTVRVSAVARSWEQLPPPAEVTWFPLGGRPRVIVSPRQGSRIGVDTPLKLTLSEPVSKLFHSLPWLGPSSTGSWRKVDEHTLLYRPRGYGYGLDTEVKVRLPAAVTPVSGSGKPTRLLTWSTPTGSQLRLQQLLAQLGYLPLSWQARGTAVAVNRDDQVAAAIHPPAGTFSWRYPNIPDTLAQLWRPGRENVVTRGAIMAFQSHHDLLVDGYAGRDFWRELIGVVLAKRHPLDEAYSYVIVHRDSSPQSLTLWRNGQTILTTPANTGISRAPTALGTYPVYARFVTTTMKGTNPDGSHYNDPGVPWVSYFNGGDAIHGFNRSSYGSAQSLGCVELPPSEAAKVFPHTTIGTLVTVTS